MNTRITSILFLIWLSSCNLFAQTWPILQIDDNDNYYIVNCNFGEIHPKDPLHDPPIR